MEKELLAAFIRKHTDITDEALTHMLPQYQYVHISKGNYLLQAGKVSDAYMFLQTGFMRSFTLDLDGQEVTTAFYYPDGVVFEASSFFLRIPATESIQALTDCTGYTLTYDRLNRLFHSIPAFRDFGRKMLVNAHVAFKQRTIGLINLSAEERYKQLIAGNSEIFQHAQLKQIASYLGITDTSLSRIRKDFAQKGL